MISKAYTSIAYSHFALRGCSDMQGVRIIHCKHFHSLLVKMHEIWLPLQYYITNAAILVYFKFQNAQAPPSANTGQL